MIQTSLDTHAITSPKTFSSLEIVEALQRSRVGENIRRCWNSAATIHDAFSVCDSCPEQNLEHFEVGCNNHVCPFCYARRAKKMYHKIINVVRSYKDVAMLTPTFETSETLTPAVLTRHSAELRAFRRLLLKEGYDISRGFSVREITFHQRGEVQRYYSAEHMCFVESSFLKKGWHPHYHILFDSSITGYIPQDLISQCLAKATQGRAYIADIRSVTKGKQQRAYSREQSLKYVMKYLFKMPVFSSIDAYPEYADATYKFRFVQPLGRAQYDDVPAPETQRVCSCCGESNFSYHFQFKDSYNAYYRKGEHFDLTIRENRILQIADLFSEKMLLDQETVCSEVISLHA